MVKCTATNILFVVFAPRISIVLCECILVYAHGISECILVYAHGISNMLVNIVLNSLAVVAIWVQCGI